MAYRAALILALWSMLVGCTKRYDYAATPQPPQPQNIEESGA